MGVLDIVNGFTRNANPLGPACCGKISALPHPEWLYPRRGYQGDGRILILRSPLVRLIVVLATILSNAVLTDLLSIGE